MRQYLPLLMMSLFVAVGCEEKDLSEPENNPIEENVVMKASFVYGNVGLKRDTIYTNDLGQQFYFEDIKLLFSDFIFFDDTDTVISDSAAFQFTYDDRIEPILRLEPGGYSLHYGMQLGLDSIRSFNTTAAQLGEQDDDIEASDFIRTSGFGVNHLIIEGRLLNPADPNDTIGTIPLKYEVGTFLTNQFYESPGLNFAVNTNRDMPLIAVIDVKPILHEFNMLGRPIISTDITNQIDLSLSIEIADSLSVGLF